MPRGSLIPRFLLVVSAGLAGCDGLVGSDLQANKERCPQTGEFGNYGCTVVVGHVHGLDGEPVDPSSHPNSLLTVRLEALRPWTGIDGGKAITDTALYRITFTRWAGPAPTQPDTVTVRFVALWQELPSASPSAGRPVHGADTVLWTLEIAPVGARFRVDTVDFHLRTPEDPLGIEP